jgi:hypothetical protein
MYASQWFLTLFAAKFPLFLVFRVLDVFLLYGADVIFQVIYLPDPYPLVRGTDTDLDPDPSIIKQIRCGKKTLASYCFVTS